MRKSVIAILLVVACLFCGHYAIAEKSFEELDAEFDALIDKSKRLQALEDVIMNGLTIYPDKSWEDEYAMDAYTVVPVIKDRDDGKQYAGMPFLITGTLLDIKGYGIDFQLDDGRYAIISFSEYDFDTEQMIDFGMYPTRKGKRFNIFCTFKSFGYELLSPETYHFTATCTEQAKTLCEKRGK
jgi:hypothetical protein